MPLNLIVNFDKVPEYITLFRNYDVRQPVDVIFPDGQNAKQSILAWFDLSEPMESDGLTLGPPEERRYLITMSYNDSARQPDEEWTIEYIEEGQYGWQTAFYVEDTDTYDIIKEKFATLAAQFYGQGLPDLEEEPDDNDDIHQ